MNNSTIHKDKLNKLNYLKLTIAKKETELNSIINNIYTIKREIQLTKSLINEAKADYHFSKKLDDIIICPMCGTSHDNKLTDKLEIISDIDQTNYLLHSLRQEYNSLDKKKNILIKELNNFKLEFKKLDKQFKSTEDNISYINELKYAGRLELIEANSNELEKMEKILSKKLLVVNRYEDLLNQMDSRKRKAEIKKQITDLFYEFSKLLEFRTDNISFITYIPVLRSTNLGSNGPRAILSYYSSLFLYNIKRNNYPFKLLVIDTPNQQGQDYKNLEKIDKAIDKLTSGKAQVIIGTERKIGLESKANLIVLTEKYRCLNKDDYTKNSKLISLFENLATN